MRNKFKIGALALGIVIFFISCEKDIEDEKFIGVSLDAEKESVPSDSLLRAVLEEEDAFREDTKAGRIVDISGMHVEKENPKKVYAHYMPWFQSLEYDGFWGQHWTMANKDPNIVDSLGQREIASYYYPIIGPYSSKDPDLQEYHLLMMKLSGIDGVIFDWYGSRNIYDYKLIKSSTNSFMRRTNDLGLDFSIMYEDRVAQQAVDEGLANNVIEAAQLDFEYIKTKYFSRPNYLKHDDKELLFVFGPETIVDSTAWNNIFSVFPEAEKPHFLTLWAAQDAVGDSASGEFLWVAEDHLVAHDYYYDTYLGNNSVTVGSTYPGFDSFYEAGGWGLQHEWGITHNAGTTFLETLNYTHHEAADFVQLVTWNDFGEGTMLEPTEEFGFLNLQLIQEYTGVTYEPIDLQTALDLYRARKEFAGNVDVEYYLDRVYRKIKKSKMERARLILLAVNTIYGS